MISTFLKLSTLNIENVCIFQNQHLVNLTVLKKEFPDVKLKLSLNGHNLCHKQNKYSATAL